MSDTKTTWGTLAEFENPGQLMLAAEKVRDASAVSQQPTLDFLDDDPENHVRMALRQPSRNYFRRTRDARVHEVDQRQERDIWRGLIISSCILSDESEPGLSIHGV